MKSLETTCHFQKIITTMHVIDLVHYYIKGMGDLLFHDFRAPACTSMWVYLNEGVRLRMLSLIIFNQLTDFVIDTIDTFY
jgi:hypothetical protein